MTHVVNAFENSLWQLDFIVTLGTETVDSLESEVEDGDGGKCIEQSGGNCNLETGHPGRNEAANICQWSRSRKTDCPKKFLSNLKFRTGLTHSPSLVS